MDSILLSIFLLFLTIIVPLQVEAHKVGHRLPQITVMGIVYCDICSNNTFSRNSYFLPGAEVKIECRFQATSPRTNEQITFSVNRTTNKHGIYKLELAAIDGIECARENAIGNLCRASLIRSSNHACNVPGYKSTTDEITIKSQAANLCIYSLNVMNFRPSKTDIALCGN
ncbi:hypothetical protein DCAR_0100908 [Daucus carota subsp. sativus]|uniref:Pollen Ole e 1 allergen and extensin family protein n=1 Tax=Daucus carota subsp. sativus TaxID=79200 RepID=A0AAF0W1P7_DAUCS|nr:PREDICTED: major pollen allergen Ole e 1-like [Daucus carota subsp. sativus]WOG81757.1 hypothetical protein DCAR_0100908 [Daucus carota subsp. sativus]